MEYGYIIMKLFLIQAINAMAEKLAVGNHYALLDVQVKQQQVKFFSNSRIREKSKELVCNSLRGDEPYCS